MSDSELETALRRNIPLLCNSQMQRDTRGHSRALCYIISSGKTKYFLKLFSGDLLQNLHFIADVYQSSHIPTAHIIDLGYLSDFDKTFCLYEYIEGPTLKLLLKDSNLETLESYGYQVGLELQKFSHQSYNIDNVQTNFQTNLENLWRNAYQQKSHYRAHQSDKLPIVNLSRLAQSAERLKPSLYNTLPTFIHDDVNLNNVIIRNNQPYFIDTNGGHISFRALDFRGNSWWGWSGNNAEREQAVYRGIYRGMFNDHIPPSFHQELAFTIIYEFIYRLERYRDIDEQTYYSFLRWHEIFQRTKYFENYHFPWF